MFVSIAFLLYSDVIFHGPFLFDDFEYIVGNPIVTDLSYFTNTSESRCLGYFSFAINYALSGESPVGFHLTNVIIHVINAMLVVGMLKTVLSRLAFDGERGPWGHTAVALFTGLVFLVHPVETQAVSYITQRFTSLSSLFYLLSIVLYINARICLEDGPEKLRRGYLIYISSVISAVLAMKTKEIAFTVPVMIAIMEFLLFGKSKYEKRRFYFLIPFAALLVIIPLSLFGPEWGLSARGSGLDEVTRRDKLYDLFQRSPYEYLITQFRVIVTYIRLLLFPVNQLAVYDYRVSHSLSDRGVAPSLLFLLALGAGAWYSWVRARKAAAGEAAYLRLVSIGVIWFFVTISVESSLIPIKDIIFEHRVYLPSVGFFSSCAGLLAIGITKVGPCIGGRIKTAVPALLILVLLSIATYARNGVWTDEVKFWDDVVRKTGKAIGYNNRGNAYSRKGQYELALRDLNKTISLFPRSGDRMAWENADFTPANMSRTYITRGRVYMSMGDEQLAEEDFAMARRIMALSFGSPLEAQGGDTAVRGNQR